MTTLESCLTEIGASEDEIVLFSDGTFMGPVIEAVLHLKKAWRADTVFNRVGIAYALRGLMVAPSCQDYAGLIMRILTHGLEKTDAFSISRDAGPLVIAAYLAREKSLTRKLNLQGPTKND